MCSFNFYDLLGVPYKKGGRDKDGFDCYGLVIECYYRMGISLPSKEDDWKASNSLKMGFVKHDIILPADIIEIDDNNHVGVAINGKHFIHATINRGVVVSPIKAYRITGVYGYRVSL